MAEVKYANSKQIQAATLTELKKAVLVEATVSLDDTVPIVELETIVAVQVFSAVDGSVIAYTKLGNVITITEDPCDNVKVFIVCVG